MSLFKYAYTLLFIVFLQIGAFSQTKRLPENYSIVVVKQKGKNPRDIADIKKISSDSIYYTSFPNNENRVFELSQVKKIYLNKYIQTFPKNKFHYKSGMLLNASLGAGYNHANFHLSLNKRKNFLEYGIGIARFTNVYYLPIGFSDISVNSTSFYINGKYILNKGKRAFYGKAKFGYNINNGNFRIDAINNGILLEPSLGLIFSSKRRTKHYLELSQHISNAEGSFTFPETNGSAVTGSFNLLFNRTVFTYGVEIGKSGNKKNISHLFP